MLRVVVTTLGVGLLFGAAAAHADIAPPPPPPPKPTASVAAPTPSSATPSTATTTTPGSTDGIAKPKRNQKVLCGCASSRFLGLKGRDPVTVGDGTLGAWLHGEARVDGFTQTEGKLAAAGLPFSIDVDERQTGGASRMVRVRATGEGEGLLGISRPGDTIPRDVATATFAGATPATTTAPALQAMWVEPVELRDRRDCGPWVTQRLAFEIVPGSPAVEGFFIKDLDTGASTLVDARHVGAFGIGRVDTCDHGFGVTNTPQRIEVVPVSATGLAGQAWGFTHDGSGTTPVTRLATPTTADPGQLDAPYPMPGETGSRFSWMSVGGFWLMLIGTGLVASMLGFIFWKLKRRRLAEVVCSSCHKGVPVDMLDDKTDGFFCPHCGASGMWKGKRVDVDVTRL